MWCKVRCIVLPAADFPPISIPPRVAAREPWVGTQLAAIDALVLEARLLEAALLLERFIEQAVDLQLVLSAAHLVHFGDLLASVQTPLCFSIGTDADGEPVACDLIKAEHLLVVGSTNADKTSFLHSLICSLLMKTTPDELMFMLIDSKQIELTRYNGIPNLLCPCITDAWDAIDNLKALVATMEQRYKLAQEYGAKDLAELNEKLPPGQKLPYILVVADEIADMLAIDRRATHTAITSMAQRGKAVGIHLVLATQFPRSDVCTSTLRRCLPSRIAFSITSRTESRMVVGTTGACDLFGDGDCLYVHEKCPPIWVQSPYVTSTEVAAIVSHWRDQIYWHERQAE